MSDGSGGGPDRLIIKAILTVLVAGIAGLVLFVVLILLAPATLFFNGESGSSVAYAAPVNSGPIPADLVAVFNVAGQTFGVDPYLLASEAYQESSFGTGYGWNVVNPDGCQGFMQIGIRGNCGDTWDEAVKLVGDPHAGSVTVHDAYTFATPPSAYGLHASPHPNLDDPFDATMAAAVILRGKVGGQPIPNLDDGVAKKAACGYYGLCGDSSAPAYADDVIARAKGWESEQLLASTSQSVGGYVNPFASISNIQGLRVDQGVDYGGDGQVRAIGNGVVFISSTGSPSVKWPRNCSSQGCDQAGGFVGYTLSDGPYAGRHVYVAENIDPLVNTLDKITAGEPIAVMHDFGAYIETGWASGSSSQPLAQVLGQNDQGITAAGASFNELLFQLGAPSGTNPTGGGVHGGIPSGYPPAVYPPRKNPPQGP